MSIDEAWGSYFKPEVQSSGRKLFSQDKISISSGSDTGIQAFVKAAPPYKVQLSSAEIGAESFTAACSCPDGSKGRLCKHIWATLLSVEGKYPDFLSAKRVIEKTSARPRASEYRKEQYQKAKLRAKAQKKSGSKRETSAAAVNAFPREVEAALAYFSANGFVLLPIPTETVLSEAKRKLSRVFHPDRGGSHDEIIELNRNSEVVLRFLRNS